MWANHLRAIASPARWGNSDPRRLHLVAAHQNTAYSGSRSQGHTHKHTNTHKESRQAGNGGNFPPGRFTPISHERRDKICLSQDEQKATPAVKAPWGPWWKVIGFAGRLVGRVTAGAEFVASYIHSIDLTPSPFDVAPTLSLKEPQGEGRGGGVSYAAFALFFSICTVRV